MIISYVRPSAFVSGDLIDFGEAIRIEALGDGVSTGFEIIRSEADIYSLRIVGARTRSGGFGLAFDDFDSGVAPEPGTRLLFGAGLADLAGWRRRSR